MSNRKHDMTATDCWCYPEVLQPCPECESDDPDCWRCGGEGLVDVYDPIEAVIVVHRSSD